MIVSMKRKPKPTQANASRALLSTTITGQSHDGRGITTTVDGKTTFVSGALPGEKVTYKLLKTHTRYNEGEVVEIIEPSSERLIPACEHFGVCGGCSLQHMSIAAQIELKQSTLLEQLKHFGQVEPETVLAPISAGSLAYRRKARLGVRYVYKKEKMLIGFREKADKVLADLNSCKILSGSVGDSFPELAKLIRSLKQYEQIPQIEIAAGDTVTALVFRHLEELPQDDIEKLKSFGKDNHYDIYLQPNLPAAVHKIWPPDSAARLSYALPDYQLEMEFHPLDFTQVNGEINPLMIKQALALLDPQSTDTVLDLFCGLGNFTLPIARFANKVIGIEGSEEMVTRAQINAEKNALTNTEFYAANLDVIPAVKPAWMKMKFDKILLDPPRTGAKEILAIFPKLSAKRIVYVSCNPATLARDAGELVHQQGYKLKTVGVINMFPHTSHIEAIAVFDKQRL
jgi:23S rRNA (uracil1939-C5)-methyltransferase